MPKFNHFLPGREVAALYIDIKNGPYPKMKGVDCWDESRDARLFPGGCPIIAHPPCGPWGYLKHFSRHQKKYLAVVAVHQVLSCGGVLEHPKGSTLWKECGLPKPQKSIPKTADAVWALEIDQSRFGHMAMKLTWILFVNIAPKDLAPLPPPQKAKYVVSKSRGGNKKREMPKKERHLTPPAFACWLVAAARAAKVL